MSNPEVHKKRIAKRKNHFFTSALLDDYIKKNWEKIKVPYTEFENINNLNWEDRLIKLL